MTRETRGAGLPEGSWEEAEAMVGSELMAITGADPVSAADIRRKLEAIAFDAPIHTDPDAARAAGHEDVVSPCSMVRTWAMPAYWQPGTERPEWTPMATPIAATTVPGVGETLMAVELDMEYGEPLYPGDRVHAVAVLESVTRKTTKVGSGAFLVVATTYRNQREEMVAVETATLFRFKGDKK